MADPITLTGVTGVHVYMTPDTGNGASVNVALVGTPYIIQVGSPVLDGHQPPVDETIIFKGN